MTGLYEVEIEPEVRSWLAGLSDREFGRVDFLVGLLAEHAEDLGEPYARHLGGKVRELRACRKITRSFLDSGTLVWYGHHGGHQGDAGGEVRNDLAASG